MFILGIQRVERESPECILQLERGSRQSGARTGSLLRAYTKYDFCGMGVEKPGKTIVLCWNRDNCNLVIFEHLSNSTESKFVS